MVRAHDIRKGRGTVIGAARSGLAAARLLKYLGIPVFLTESQPASACHGAEDQLLALGVPYEFDGHSERALDAEFLIVSPGVPSDAPLVLEGHRRGLLVLSEIELGSLFFNGVVIAITGTNGKTTTTTLTGEILKASGKDTIVAGNIGYAFCDALVEKSLTADVAVLEVSSFQLDHCLTFHPHIAVITTITPDHLGRYHNTLSEYAASKQRIFMNHDPQDILIYNMDNALTVDSVHGARSLLTPFSVKRTLEYGGWMEARRLMVDIGMGREQVASIDEVQIRGAHNYMNILMAALASRKVGVPLGVVQDVVRSFQGIAHRLEFVRKLDSVTWVNDSKATNVDSLITALESFHQPVVLIAGGRDKGTSYEPVFPLMREKVKTLILIGEAADRMEEAFSGMTTILRAENLPEAVSRAHDDAVSGDVVLLSPACASFDMFENFEHRGMVFKSLVHSLTSRNFVL